MRYETFDDFMASLHPDIRPYAVALLRAAGVPEGAEMSAIEEVMTSDVDWDRYEDPDLFGEDREGEPEQIEMMMDEVAGTETELVNTISAWNHLYEEAFIRQDKDGDSQDYDGDEDEDGDYDEDEINAVIYYRQF
jgi:phytoene/squalene synthetase